MKMQLLGEIKYRLSVTDLSLGSIADEFDFASLAHFPDIVKDIWDVLLKNGENK